MDILFLCIFALTPYLCLLFDNCPKFEPMNKEQEVIEYARQQLKIAQDNVMKWQFFLEASNIKEEPIVKAQTLFAEAKVEEVKAEKKERKVSTISNGTLKSHIVKFLKSNGDLYSGREMFEHVVNQAQYTGNYTSFAGKLSVLVTKNVLAKAVIEDVPNDRKYWYGLKEWWEGDKLKTEYQTKLDVKING